MPKNKKKPVLTLKSLAEILEKESELAKRYEVAHSEDCEYLRAHDDRLIAETLQYAAGLARGHTEL